MASFLLSNSLYEDPFPSGQALASVNDTTVIHTKAAKYNIVTECFHFHTVQPSPQKKLESNEHAFNYY